MKEFPNWFWFSILAFVVIAWLAIPISALLTDHARNVARTIVFIGLIIYPLFYVTLLLLLFRKTKLDSDKKIWAFFILLVPIAIYFPFWSVISH
ncbi:putative membrane channel-forming protein YqfA (hemolysin III family) [Evansella vedderi]|uniref:Membrane channel-forming protein YqfA (Hemolysin III family) n=1 Tax=Evansella vedderi TaxID=38282 RepID=A0ABT9ZVR7_9BACI|nr:hypothetical protein [Evansella vedderi]MDQ0254832.1 putative membrane channel-forming protein YqfA (hemolysin III family) [Evansella vedderi]